MMKVNCKICGKEINTYPSWVKSGKSQYCSRACQLPVTNRILEENGVRTRFIKGGNTWNKIGFQYTKARKNGNSYKLISIPSHPFANKDGYVREHRLVMEKSIGRYLRKDEIVHHIDGNTLNNEISNLEITTVSEHTSYHLKLRHAQRKTLYGKSSN